MEDDKIRELFSNFQPPLSSTPMFMARLQKNMEAVEIVRQYNKALRRRNRLAVAIAAVCGFVMGVITTLVLPLIGGSLTSLSVTLPRFMQSGSFAIDGSILSWILTAGVSVIFAINAYEIAMAKLPKEEGDCHS